MSIEDQGRPRLVALAAGRLQVVGVLIAAVALGGAFAFEVLASARLTGARVGWGRSDFRLWSWGFDYGNGALINYRHAPLLLFAASLVGTIALSASFVGRSDAIRRASGRALMWRWSRGEGKRRLRTELKAVGSAGLLRARVRPLLVVGFVASALVALLALMGPQSTATVELETGVGPRLCLAASLIALAGTLLAWPWSHPRPVSIGADGEVRPWPATEPEAPPRPMAPSPPASAIEPQRPDTMPAAPAAPPEPAASSAAPVELPDPSPPPSPNAPQPLPALSAAADSFEPSASSRPASVNEPRSLRVVPDAATGESAAPSAPSEEQPLPPAVGGVVSAVPSTGPAPTSPTPASGSPPIPDVVDQLERLAALYRSGALTEAQFEIAKTRLLGD